MQAGFASKPAGRHAFPLEGGANAFDEIRYHGSLESTSGYALQEQKHMRICADADMHRRMDRTPDERREILRTFINTRGLKIAKWAKQAGVGKNSIYNFLNGHSDGLDPINYAKLARSAEVPVHQLTGDAPDPPSPTTIWVAGHIEAGYFQDAVEWDQSRWYAVDVPVPTRFRKKAKALEVRGPSMNMEYPDGSIVVWVDQLDFRPARDGDHVIVYSYAADDSIEATVKELRIAEGKEWLWPRSHHPAHQQPIDVANPPEHVRRVEIQGIVLGGYKPRVV